MNITDEKILHRLNNIKIYKTDKLVIINIEDDYFITYGGYQRFKMRSLNTYEEITDPLIKSIIIEAHNHIILSVIQSSDSTDDYIDNDNLFKAIISISEYQFPFAYN